MSDVANFLIILSDSIHLESTTMICLIVSLFLIIYFNRVSVTMQLALVVDIMKILRLSSLSLTLHLKQTLTVYHLSN